MHRHLNTDILDLYVSGTSSPIKSQAEKAYSVELYKKRAMTATPDTRISLSNKWYIRGHKFVTIYKIRAKPKPHPALYVSGTVHRKTPTPYVKSRLIVSQEYNRKRINQSSEGKKRCIFKNTLTSRLLPKSSSKSFQVDFQDLSSWSYK
ncbi:hypothetical protein SteCoe_33933 [Stentor coeruleus]|uniref:Uncharacterized protein n=1 Tax=Stentor coeruleus TaxID=5963 RepID=A0A1R2AVN4_9CILI|nr:hypothetical protein SteCoe_33933 [Stentor coeruleus]